MHVFYLSNPWEFSEDILLQLGYKELTLSETCYLFVSGNSYVVMLAAALFFNLAP